MKSFSLRVIAVLSIFMLVFSVGVCAYVYSGGMGAMLHAHSASAVENHLDHAHSLTLATVSWVLLFSLILCYVVTLGISEIPQNYIRAVFVAEEGVIPKSQEFNLYKKLRSPPFC